ncbi:MAG: lamin tail domain-containing protein, partial [Verrucomicrobiales bacterium]
NIPTAPIRPGRTYRARVRHQDDSGRWSHWSEPLQFVASEPDTTPFEESIVISEFMYHPAAATPAELALGFSDESFEYIEITNIGNANIDLSGLRFTKGVDFDFLGSDITDLDPGARALIVTNRAAFESRYGAGMPIAGEWEPGDRLSNGGERLKLSFGAGIPIRDFEYLDESPWPSAPDGGGFSLTLIDPGSNPDHKDPASWRSSVAPGGSPGGEDFSSFDTWAAGFGLQPDDPDLDIDRDGIALLREYAQGGRPDAALPGEGQFDVNIEKLVVDQVAAHYLILSIARNLAADDVDFRIERNSSSLTGQWQDITEEFVLHSDQPLAAGTALLRYRSPLPTGRGQFWRVRFTAE